MGRAEAPLRDGWARMTSGALFNATAFFRIAGVLERVANRLDNIRSKPLLSFSSYL